MYVIKPSPFTYRFLLHNFQTEFNHSFTVIHILKRSYVDLKKKNNCTISYDIYRILALVSDQLLKRSTKKKIVHGHKNKKLQEHFIEACKK